MFLTVQVADRTIPYEMANNEPIRLASPDKSLNVSMGNNSFFNEMGEFRYDYGYCGDRTISGSVLMASCRIDLFHGYITVYPSSSITPP